MAASLGGPKRPHALILAGFVLGTFGYFLVLFILPFVVGPWALVLGTAFGVGSVLAARRHVRRNQRRPHIDLRLGWRRPAPSTESSLETAVAVMFLFGIFVAALFVLGYYLRTRFATLGTDAAVGLLGGGIVLFATYVAMGILAERDPRYALGLPWIVEDTTDDT